MNREIVDYIVIDSLSVYKYIKDGRQPFGSPFLETPREDGYEYIHQAMVKYAPLPDSVQLSVKYCQSNGVVGMSKPAVYTCKDCGQQRRGGQTTPVCHCLSGTDDND